MTGTHCHIKLSDTGVVGGCRLPSKVDLAAYLEVCLLLLNLGVTCGVPEGILYCLASGFMFCYILWLRTLTRYLHLT